MIEVQNLTKRFGGVAAVDDCSLDVTPGIITSIIGPNGAGKTTLFNLICGITYPDKGTIRLSGADITSRSTYMVARAGISRTFQQARLFKNLSVKENLLLAKDAQDKELQEALDKVFFPLPMSTKAEALSYGQSRLLEIARALLKPHRLLMLDEPTAGVNPLVRRELKKILKSLKAAGSTILSIEHDIEFVMSVSDEVIVMAQGKVLTRGSPAQIQQDKRVLEVYLGK